MCKVKLNNLSLFATQYPRELVSALRTVAELEGEHFYVVGGTVRDLLLGTISHDIDIAVSRGAVKIARLLIRQLGGGVYVDLCSAHEEAARVVWQNIQVDFASFRGGAKTIEEDLQMRDVTINSIGVTLAELVGSQSFRLIDPTGGYEDLCAGRLRHCQSAFTSDPVRMLRVYRFHAVLGFSLVQETESEIGKHAPLISTIAAERVSYELDLIFKSQRTAAVLKSMHDVGLLREIVPELYEGEGVEQPEFHHLDVFEHNMVALRKMEGIIGDPEYYFPEAAGAIKQYLQRGAVTSCLKWAALLHDIGKPSTKGMSVKEKNRVTFYRHDEVGRDIFCGFADRMRWSRQDKENTAALIGMHMHPFHLCNVERDNKVTKKAALKLCRRAGGQLLGLFLLAMSDSMASNGEKKPAEMEGELVSLLDKILQLYEENIKPVLSGPRLLTGKELIEDFGLSPGPLFSEIFEALDIERVEGRVNTRGEAVVWVEKFLLKFPSNL